MAYDPHQSILNIIGGQYFAKAAEGIPRHRREKEVGWPHITVFNEILGATTLVSDAAKNDVTAFVSSIKAWDGSRGLPTTVAATLALQANCSALHRANDS